MNVLSKHSRIIATLPLARSWTSLCYGPNIESDNKAIPLLLTDPVALVLHFILLTPANLSLSECVC